MEWIFSDSAILEVFRGASFGDWIVDAWGLSILSSRPPTADLADKAPPLGELSLGIKDTSVDPIQYGITVMIPRHSD